MAATGYTPISLYYSTTVSGTPLAANLVNGELAINITDGKLFYKDNAGVVQTIATKAGANGDVVGPASATANAVVRFDGTTGKLVKNSAVTIADTTGDITTAGNLTLNAQGDVRFADSDSSNWVALQGPATVTSNVTWTLPATDGTNGQVLTTNGTGTLSWATAATSLSISNDTATSTNVYPAFMSATSGTASTIFTSNAKLLYKPSTGEFQSSALVASNGIVLNNTTVASSYTIATGSNGMSIGPITVNSGITVTVSSGQRWLVL